MPNFKKLSNAPILGKYLKKTFAAGQPSGTTLNVTGLTTVSYVNGAMRVAGGSGNYTTYTENITMDNRVHGDKFEHLCVFKPIVAGAGFVLRRVEPVNDASNWVRVELTNDGRKGMITWGYNNNTNSFTSQLSSFTYDKDLLYVREYTDKEIGGHFMEIGYYRNNGQLSGILRFPLDRYMTFKCMICFVGGTTDFYEHSFISKLTKNAKIMGIGDSNMFGYDASGVQGREWQYGYLHNLQRMTNEVIDEISFAGAQITHHLSYIQQVIDASPEYVMINDGTNDMLLSTPFATYQANYLSYCNQLLAAGIKIIHFGSFPGQPANVLANYQTWNTWKQGLANGTTQFYVDVKTALKDPSSESLNPAYWGASGTDGTHVAYTFQYIVSDALAPQLRPFIFI